MLLFFLFTDGEDGNGWNRFFFTCSSCALKMSQKHIMVCSSFGIFFVILQEHFFVRVKVLSNDFSTELTWTQQNPRNTSPLYIIWVKVLSNDFSSDVAGTQQNPRDSAPLYVIWVKVLGNDFSAYVAWTQQNPLGSTPLSRTHKFLHELGQSIGNSTNCSKLMTHECYLPF